MFTRLTQSVLTARLAGLTLLIALTGGTFAAWSGSIAAQESTTAEMTVGVIAEPDDALLATLATCDDVAALPPGQLATVPDDATGYVINGEPSEARYVIDEELGGVGANTAIGRTNAFIGQILVGDDATPIACSRFDVDMRTLESDSSRRDNYLRGNTLKSDEFPVATFVVRGIEGLEGPLTADEQVFWLIGDLTFRGDTQLVVWEASVAIDGETLVGSAFTEFELADFDIEKPIVGSVISIADTVRLEVDIDAPVA